VTGFEPFAPPAGEEQAGGESEGFEQPERHAPEDFEQPQGYPESESHEPEGLEQPQSGPNPESSDEPESTEDQSFAEPQSAEPQSFDAPGPEPMASPAGEGDSEEEPRTEWPHMYASRTSRAYEAEVELSPQPQEPHIADAPAADYSRPDELQGPEVENLEPAEPVDDLQAHAARAVQEPASEDGGEVPGLPGAPVEEPRVDEPAPPAPEEASVSDAPADASDDAPADEEVTVKPMETVSAIDMIMGGDEEDQRSSSDEDSEEHSSPAQPEPDDRSPGV
jgi:hypothetical protein